MHNSQMADDTEKPKSKLLLVASLFNALPNLLRLAAPLMTKIFRNSYITNVKAHAKKMSISFPMLRQKAFGIPQKEMQRGRGFSFYLISAL